MNKPEARNNLEKRKDQWGDSLEGHVHSRDWTCPDCNANYEYHLMHDLTQLREHIIGYTNSPPIPKPGYSGILLLCSPKCNPFWFHVRTNMIDTILRY